MIINNIQQQKDYYDLSSRMKNQKKYRLPIIKIKKTLRLPILLITLHRLKWHTNLITFEKPMKTGKNTLIGIKLPSSRATYPNLLNIKMNHNSQAQLYIFLNLLNKKGSRSPKE